MTFYLLIASSSLIKLPIPCNFIADQLLPLQVPSEAVVVGDTNYRSDSNVTSKWKSAAMGVRNSLDHQGSKEDKIRPSLRNIHGVSYSATRACFRAPMLLSLSG